MPLDRWRWRRGAVLDPKQQRPTRTRGDEIEEDEEDEDDGEDDKEEDAKSPLPRKSLVARLPKCFTRASSSLRRRRFDFSPRVSSLSFLDAPMPSTPPLPYWKLRSRPASPRLVGSLVCCCLLQKHFPCDFPPHPSRRERGRTFLMHSQHQTLVKSTCTSFPSSFCHLSSIYLFS
eukprot:GHVT01002880.1.p1 GENE.GHVT01002880.1~~GHVT01002880.1.p1  ORF type:complete len:175 (-),score=35.13 GHVT01002880.1:228-752(-)